MDDLKLLRGKPARLYVLDFGLFRVHSGPHDIGICGFLIITDLGALSVIVQREVVNGMFVCALTFRAKP